jgi:hypothetical protein
MKKTVKHFIAYIMAFATMITVLSGFAATGVSAAETDLNEFVKQLSLPAMPYESLEAASLPVDDIRQTFDNAVEFTFVDGLLRVKSIGEETFEFYDTNYNEIEYELVDGYYRVNYTEEQFEEGFHANLRGEDDIWYLNYEGSLERRFIYIYDNNQSRSVTIYPDNGWSGLVQVRYSATNDITVCDDYDFDGFYQHEIRVYLENGDFFEIIYNANNEVYRIMLSVDNEHYYYYAETGWEDYVPDDYADYAESFYTSLGASMLGCDHEWIDASCFNAKHCSVCHAQDGTSLPHDWKTVDGSTVCSVCSFFMVSPVILPEFSFTGITPKAKLSEVNLPIEKIEKALDRNINVKTNGNTVTVSASDEDYISVYVNGEYCDCVSTNANTFVFELFEDSDASDVEIFVSFEGEGYYAEVVYGIDGKPSGDYYVSFEAEDEENDETVNIGYIEASSENDIYILYYYDNYLTPTFSYKDVYVSGSFCEREVARYYDDDLDTEIEVRYNARGEVTYVEIEEDENDAYYNFENDLWSDGRNYVSPEKTPKIAEGKTIGQIIELCPSGLDFIKPQKESTNVTVIVISVVFVIAICGAAFGGYAIGKKKK